MSVEVPIDDWAKKTSSIQTEYERLTNGTEAWQLFEKELREIAKEGPHKECKILDLRSDASSGKFPHHQRKAFAEVISAFANTEGGIVIWGIKSKRDKCEIHLVPDAGLVAEHMNQFVHELVSPVPLVESRAVQNEQGSGVVVTLVKPLSLGPIMAIHEHDNRYYGRAAETTYRLTDRIVRALMLERQLPQYQLGVREISGALIDRHSLHSGMTLRASLTITNKSDVLSFPCGIILEEPTIRPVSHNPQLVRFGDYRSSGSERALLAKIDPKAVLFPGVAEKCFSVACVVDEKQIREKRPLVIKATFLLGGTRDVQKIIIDYWENVNIVNLLFDKM